MEKTKVSSEKKQFLQLDDKWNTRITNKLKTLKNIYKKRHTSKNGLKKSLDMMITALHYAFVLL